MISDPADAALGLLVMYAADMYKGAPAQLAPPVDSRLAANWIVIGYFTGIDAIFRKGLPTMAKGQEVCYGVLVASKANPRQFAAVVRGTEGIAEWIEDAEFHPMPYPNGPGTVEAGFWGIYQSMMFKVDADDPGKKACDGIAAAVPAGAELMVVGHSLGSALATYLTFDLARVSRAGRWVSARLFASPHPGDTAFANAFDSTVGSDRYMLYNYFLDAVPRVPFGPDYDHLPHVTDLRPSEAQARIRFELACNHHIVCYCAMLDYQQTNSVPLLGIDQTCSSCIKGPASSTLPTASTASMIPHP
ncbi:lipase family protein [Variovorax sp. dw_954]|uniref:lipase family protein n=1 Tax=Variovorax sp. dw_954 TaxID=2720078 RepID=UPI001BD67942|nr:lipase family protein [Variovorax sp. dw_954]